MTGPETDFAHIDPEVISEAVASLKQANPDITFCPRCLSMALIGTGILEALNGGVPPADLAEALRAIAERVTTGKHARRRTH